MNGVTLFYQTIGIGIYSWMMNMFYEKFKK